MSRREFLKSMVAAGTCGALSSRSAWAAAPNVWKAADPPNQPIGRAQGIFPGRVVWIHEPDVVRWDGDTDNGGWYEDRFTDPEMAEQMLRRTLQTLTGATTDAQAWAALFRHFNRTHGRGDAGYRPGEKVVIKLNMNCSQRRADPKHGFYNTPQLNQALLRQLVRQAGVREADIVVYDASRLMSDTIFEPGHAEFPGIRFEDRDGGEGRFQSLPDKNAALHFGDPATPDHGRTYLPTCVTGATYMINAAVLKGHSLAGVTLCAKNHYGSVYREDAGPNDAHRGWNPSHLHEAITLPARPMATYNPLVDLMGHKHLGGKTMLYLIDGLYAAPHQSRGPQRWQSAPFDGHWTASVFASQDAVAIESVGLDFFAAEGNVATLLGAADNYLHEAALAHRPPSEIAYDPEGDRSTLESLGVHEHWNDARKKQYSGNLGTGAGIELVTG